MSRSRLFGALPRFHRGAFILFVIAVLCTAILGDQPLAHALILDPGAFARGEGLWQPLTANFIFREGHAGGLIFTLAVQWFLGSTLEQVWGTRRYVATILGCATAGYLVSAVLGVFVPAVAAVPVAGTTPLDLAAVVGFGVVFGRQRLALLGFLPLNARTLAILIVVVGLLSPLARGAPWPTILPLLVSMGLALLLTLRPWRKLRSSGKVRGRRKSRKANHLKVVEPEGKLLH